MFKPSDLSNFYGSEGLFFHPLFRKVDYTDGVRFLLANGASWLVTDILAVLSSTRYLALAGGFLSIKCVVKDGGAKLTIDDGNGKVYHKQSYPVTDLPCDVSMYCEHGMVKPVLMLVTER